MVASNCDELIFLVGMHAVLLRYACSTDKHVMVDSFYEKKSGLLFGIIKFAILWS